MMLAGIQHVGCVGIKRRLADAEAANTPGGADAGEDIHESVSSKRRKGINQRVQAAEEQSASSSQRHDEPNPLLKRLVKRWAEGKRSSVELQGMAMDAEASGTRGMSSTASIGAGGKHTQNCFRALKSLLGMPSGAPYFLFGRRYPQFAATAPFILSCCHTTSFLPSSAQRIASGHRRFEGLYMRRSSFGLRWMVQVQMS